MDNREKQILAFRTATISGAFSLVVCIVMLLNFWQLQSTDPIESKALLSLVERFQDDTRNEELKVEIRQLDLMVRNAFFTNQWQIRSGAFLLIAGIIIMILSFRIYYGLKSGIELPDSTEAQLDLELLISRRWIVYTVALVFGCGLIASFLSINHLSNTYALTEINDSKGEIPIQEIVPIQDKTLPIEVVRTEEVENTTIQNPEDAIPAKIDSDTQKNSDEKVSALKEAEINPSPAAVTGNNDITNHFSTFRGPNGLGVSYHKNSPTSWDGASGKNILWKIPIALPGFSSPVIWENQVFLTGANKDKQSVYCFDLETGKIIWEHEVSGVQRPAGKMAKPTDDTGYAAPTVATDGRHIYAIFASGDLVCTDMKGSRVWAKNMGIPDNHYGHSSSLMVWKDLLFIQFDTNKAGNVKALNTLSGDLVWETKRSSKISWASPILADLGDHVELVLSTSPQVSAYDPATGKELWSVECLMGEVGPSPAFLNGIVYAANEYANLVAIKPGSEPSVLWESNEYLPEVASPVAVNGLLFIGTSYGVIACFDTSNGEILWEYECDQGIYASPIVSDGKVYFLDMDGIMHIFQVDSTLKLIGEPELGEKAVSTPAFADGKIVLRAYDQLYCIGN